MKLEYVVIVTDHNGVFDCILDCGIVESLEAANEAIRESKEEDARQGWQYEYCPVPVTRANPCVQLTGGHAGQKRTGSKPTRNTVGRLSCSTKESYDLHKAQ